MPIRLSGLSSGLDTEAIIKEMMSVQSMRKTKVENKLTKLEWKEEKWKELNQKIYDLYKDELSSFKSQSSYLTKAVTASDTTKATFTASSKVPTGTHTLSITEVASSQFITGNKVSATASDGTSVSVNSSTKITNVKFCNVVGVNKTEGYIAAGTVLNLKVGDEDTQYYTITAETSISDLTTWFKSNNVSFSYDTNNQKFFLSSMQSGVENAFTLTSTVNYETNNSASSQYTYIKNQTGMNASNLADNTGDTLKSTLASINEALSVFQYGTTSDTAATQAEHVLTAAARAKQHVYSTYVQSKINEDANHDNYEMHTQDDGSIKVYDKVNKKYINDFDTALNTDFNTIMSEPDYQTLYKASFDSALGTIHNSTSLLNSGKTAGDVVGLAGSKQFHDQFNMIKNTEVLSYNVGGTYAFSNLKDVTGGTQYLKNLTDALSTYRNLLSSATDKDAAEATINKYAQANYVAQKEVYKKYITDQWTSIIGDKKDEITLEWDDEGNWSLTKAEDSDLSLSTYRQKLSKADDKYDFDTFMTGENKATYIGTYTEMYQKVVDGAYWSETEAENKNKFNPANYSMTNTFAAIETGNSALDLLGIGEIDAIPGNETDVTSGATYVKASDMTCTFNGASYTSASNTLTINGLTINAIDKTTSDIKISVTNDTKAVYDKVKSFIKAYNEVLKSMNDLYYADSARKYDVLSDEERDAMTDEQIEKWENKIKNASLRRDTTLESILSAMRSLTSTSVNVEGKDYDLIKFGINTGDYTEKGLLHIDGDSEDSTYADKTDKLMEALSSDPDTVMQVFSKIGTELYSKLSDKMSSTTLSSALTFFNDKEITSMKKDYEDEIDKWEDKLSDMEDKYYKKFSAMEVAMSKLNSQTNYISSLFGTGQ